MISENKGRNASVVVIYTQLAQYIKNQWRGLQMSVKIKISYTTKEELEKVLRVLSPVMKDYKIAKNQEGQYKKAYAYLK